jgi:AcrR family transcriptional regulator
VRAVASRKAAASKSRRDLLLDEAASQFNAKAVSLTSLTDLSDSLGVSRAALYYYVEDREDLVFQVYRRSCEILARHLGEAIAPGRGAIDIVQRFVAGTLDEDAPEIAALSEIGLLRADDRETVLGLYEGVVARLAGILEAGAKSGEIRRCDFPVAARTIISVIHWIPLSGRWTVAVESPDRGELIATINDMVANGWSADRTRIVDPPPVDLTKLRIGAAHAFDREALADAKRETILATASRLFNRKGVDSTSLDEIAIELGATKRTLYHYVGDKQAIVAACFERSHRIHMFMFEETRAMNLSPIEVLVAYGRGSAILAQTPELEPLRPVVGFDAFPKDEYARATQRSRELSRNFQQRYAAARAAHQVRDLDIRMLMLTRPGVTAWLAKGIVAADERRRAEIADETVKLVHYGLKRA